MIKASKEEVENEIYQKRKEVRYDVRDMTVEMIVNKYEDGKDDKNQSQKFNYIYIPEYQRDFVWDEARQSKLIESIIMGLPIPFIFVAENNDSSWEIVDGSQRIRTLYSFISDQLELKKLEAIKSLNGYKFSELEKSRQGKILSTALRIIVLSEETTDDVKTDMFERINRGSDLLKPMETRRGSTRGKFSEFIEQYSENPMFRECAPVAKNLEKRREWEELILRFFAISDTEKYECGISEGVSAFLDEYYKRKNDEWNILSDEELNKTKGEYTNRINKVVEYVHNNFPYGFRHRHNPQTKRAVFEAVSIGVWLAIKRKNIKEQLDKEQVNETFDSSDFKEYVLGANESHSKRKLRGRVYTIYNLVRNSIDEAGSNNIR